MRPRFSAPIRLSGLLVWLVVVWILLWGEFSAANLVSGVVVAWLIVLGSGIGYSSSTARHDRARISPVNLIRFIFYVLFQLIRSNLVLAREILTPGSRIRSGIVSIQLRTDQPAVMVVVANVITLTPGTMTLEASGSPARLYVNVLQLHDPERVRRDVRDIEERAVKAFGSLRAREQMKLWSAQVRS